jgi:hypothetical protein
MMEMREPLVQTRMLRAVSAQASRSKKRTFLPAAFQFRRREILLNDIVNRASHPNVLCESTARASAFMLQYGTNVFSSERFRQRAHFRVQSLLAVRRTTPTSFGWLACEATWSFLCYREKH